MRFSLDNSRAGVRWRWVAAVGCAWLLGQAFSLPAELAVVPGESGNADEHWAEVVEPDFPFYSSVLDARRGSTGLPANNLTPRGLVLNLGHNCWACFDTDLLRIAALWTGAEVTPISMAQGSYHLAGVKAREGQEILPQPGGDVWLANGIYAGWQPGESWTLADPREPGPDPREVGRGPLPATTARFRAIQPMEGGTRLDYEAGGAPVKEWITAHSEAGHAIIQRRFHLEHVPVPMWLILGRTSTEHATTLRWAISGSTASSPAGLGHVEQPDGLHVIRLAPAKTPVEFQVAVGLGPVVKTREPIRDDQAPAGSSRRWPQTLLTRGTLAGSTNAFVVDHIALPLDNPWRRNIRLADIAFLKDGRAAAVTFDGDVWMISGLRGKLEAVRWQRFASGLHEPLGLCVRQEEIFVFDRNGIWRLRDRDGNGEADTHELFSNAFTQTAETREYAHGIRSAPDGSFVIAKGGIQFATRGRDNGTVLRISPDGARATVLGYGFRSPFIGVHPESGLVTASDQQGYYVPSTPLHVVRDGQFYGFLPAIVPPEKYPAPLAEPLTWIPHPVNASGAAQVWLTGARLGPLNGALIHFGYYRPELFLIRLNGETPPTQAAALSLTRDLEFAPLSGAVNPVDGQLYVTGFQIFGTTARQISGLARLRHTGAACTLPRALVPMAEGVLLRFDEPLDAEKARQPNNFFAERWNYVRTAQYGSPHYKLDGSKGQDPMPPSSAYLSRDGKSVFVGIPGMRPVMQMRFAWTLATREGLSFEQTGYFTPRDLRSFDPAAEGFEPVTVDLTPRELLADPSAPPATVDEGKRVSELMGCVACHSSDGSTIGKVGPTWKGLYGSARAFADGNQTVADEAYLRESIRAPALRIVRGFEKSESGMPSYEGVLTPAQIDALVLYIEALH